MMLQNAASGARVQILAWPVLAVLGQKLTSPCLCLLMELGIRSIVYIS